MSKVIFITGTPGVGKTTVADHYREQGIPSYNLYDLAVRLDCLLEKDEKRDAMIVDDDCLHNKLDSWLEGQDDEIILLESHFADVVPNQYVVRVFVLQPSIEVLRPRLIARGYSKEKVQENIEAHIMQECYFDAIEYYTEDKVQKIDPEETNIYQMIDTIIKSL